MCVCVCIFFVWCNQNGHHPKEDLSKFGYKLNMDFFSKEILYHLATLWKPIVKISRVVKKIGGNLENLGPIFFMMNPLQRLKSIFKGWKVIKVCQERKPSSISKSIQWLNAHKLFVILKGSWFNLLVIPFKVKTLGCTHKWTKIWYPYTLQMTSKDDKYSTH